MCGRVVPEDPYKLIAITPAEQKEKNICFQKEVISQYAGEVHSFFSNDCYQEIVPEGISKGFAVRWFCDYLGIPIENSVAAGDAQNDVEMLKAAMWELSCAMLFRELRNMETM